jgi:hypothetical protein
MPAKQITPLIEVAKHLNSQIGKINQKLDYILAYAGEVGVNDARTEGSYQDRTGNLRSSTGYVIADNGSAKQTSEFSQVKQGAEGVKEGNDFAKGVSIREFTKGKSLIIVAGMSYAGFVSAKGRNVLDSSELRVKKLVPQMLKQIGFK